MARRLNLLNLLILLLPITLMYVNLNAALQIKITNLQCETIDPIFCTIRTCKLKMIRRGVSAVNVEGEFHTKIESFKLKVTLSKNSNGFKPFVSNYYLDMCKNDPEVIKTDLLASVLRNYIKEFTNLNHSCPYEHNIIVKDLILSEERARFIPLPNSEYMVHLTLVLNGQPRSSIKIYATQSD